MKNSHSSCSTHRLSLSRLVLKWVSRRSKKTTNPQVLVPCLHATAHAHRPKDGPEAQSTGQRERPILVSAIILNSECRGTF